MPLDQDIIWTAAEQANRLSGKWMPHRWLELFIDSYNDIEACRAVPQTTKEAANEASGH